MNLCLNILNNDDAIISNVIKFSKKLHPKIIAYLQKNVNICVEFEILAHSLALITTLAICENDICH